MEVSPDTDSATPYLRLDTCTKNSSLESIVIHSDVKNSPKNRVNTRTFTKTQCRQSELELIFQVKKSSTLILN